MDYQTLWDCVIVVASYMIYMIKETTITHSMITISTCTFMLMIVVLIKGLVIQFNNKGIFIVKYHFRVFSTIMKHALQKMEFKFQQNIFISSKNLQQRYI